MSSPAFILASASPRRVELLRELVTEFQVVTSAQPELESEHLTACELAQANAYRKAWAVARQFPQAIVLGADTIVTLELKLFGKPRDRVEASRMLEQLQGQTHQVVTGVCLLQRQG